MRENVGAIETSGMLVSPGRTRHGDEACFVCAFDCDLPAPAAQNVKYAISLVCVGCASCRFAPAVGSPWTTSHALAPVSNASMILESSV